MCQWGANRNSRAGYRMSPCQTPTNRNRGVANRRPQIEHIMRLVKRPDHHCGDDLVFIGKSRAFLTAELAGFVYLKQIYKTTLMPADD